MKGYFRNAQTYRCDNIISDPYEIYNFGGSKGYYAMYELSV